MSDYKPGTVATLLVDGCEVTGLAAESGWMYADSAGAGHLTFEQVTDVRPLVVLDIDFWPLFLVKYLRGTLFNQHLLNNEQQDCLNQIADQIERQVKPPAPPKPEEPTGLGAVVEDSAGNSWVRNAPDDDAMWRSDYGDWSDYQGIDAVRVLSEGVRP